MRNTNNLPTSGGRETLITREDLDRMLELSFNPELMSRGKEAVLWNKDSFPCFGVATQGQRMNIVNSKLSAGSLNPEKIIDKFSWYNNWRKENSKLNFKYDEL
jgi:hypothetical protein